jgi:hypothetical protein
MPPGWPYAVVRLPPGINEVAASARTPVPETWVAHPLDLDIGEVADGYHLIVRGLPAGTAVVQRSADSREIAENARPMRVGKTRQFLP